uniref:Sperm antigen with calponin homology and coiled-coil domains 1 n=1 Tax=Latimeria chalumnae TaxID=7897 RepID=M3XIZ5_LATCH
MKSSTRSLGVVAKQGSHGAERARPLTSTPVGIKTSKSSTSLSSESRLSRLKRASSDDMLTKPGGAALASSSRMKKTVTAGAISELAEGRIKHGAGPVASGKRTGIPVPRELPAAVSRDKPFLRGPSVTKKGASSPTSSNVTTPTKYVRTAIKPKQESEANGKTMLESQVKELLAEAKTKDFEISSLRSELKKCRDKGSPNSETPGQESGNLLAQPAEEESLIKGLKEKNWTFQHELAVLREENQVLKEKLIALEYSPSLETSTSNSTNSNLPTPSTQESSFGSPLKSPVNGDLYDKSRVTVNGGKLRSPSSSSSDVTKVSPSSDTSEFENIADVSSRTDSSNSISFKGSKCSTTGNSPGDVSELSVACLTEKIQKMEETHHSTAEELQATLQELSDQQQMVQELTADNERFVEEKAMLESSLHQQRERVEQLVQENENLMALLKERAKTEETEVKEKRVLELEQRYDELIERSRFEREKLLNIQQQFTSSLRSLEKEHQEAQGLIKSLKEENSHLQRLLESEQQAKNEMAKAIEDYKSMVEGSNLENGHLKAQLEMQKQAAVEYRAGQGSGETLELLNVSQLDKEQLCVAYTELKQKFSKANGEVRQLQGMLEKMEAECRQLKELCDKQAEELNSSSLKREEESSETEAEIKHMKEAIFELEDQVEQHRAVRLHNNQMMIDLENNVLALEEQKLDLEKQLKALNRQMKEDAEEWRRFQADLQTAVVVANEIKIEAQQEVRALRKRLHEEEEQNLALQKEMDELKGNRITLDKLTEEDAGNQWHGVSASRTSPVPSEPSTTVKSLIKSFDAGFQEGSSQPVQIHTVPRSPLSGIPVRTAPAAAVSPMQRHASSSSVKLISKAPEKRAHFAEFPMTDMLKGRSNDLKPEQYLRKSPSLESIGKAPSIAVSSRSLAMTSSHPKLQSRLSVERMDPLTALARAYGGSKRNALLKWCQQKTEGYQNIDITNFSSSWSDGLAFCALLHTYLPAHIPYQELSSQDKKRNLMLAFQAAESVGIKPALEITDMVNTDRPNWQSVMQYIAQIYKYFET